MAIEFGCEDGEPSTMKLTLEPASGGDLRATAGASGVVEQVKMRSAGRRWSTREVAATVMKDLLAAVGPGGPGTFRFVTDNSAGLADLEALVAAREAGGKPAPETIAKVADALGVPVDDERLARLLAGFEIVIVDARDVETEVEEAIARMLAPGQDASEKRHALTSRLLVAAKNGETLGAADLMAMIHPEALLRLTHANTLASSLAARLGRDCRALGYERSRQARDRRVVPEGALHVLSGESGQGKTWSACHCAHSLADEGEAVIVVGGATDFDGLARVVAERVAAGAYERPPSIPAMAARLRPSLSGPDGHWLTVFVDDVQDRRFAASLAASDWGERGVRLVVTCQPRIAGVFEDADADATIEEVGDFTSAELRRHLALHGRAAPLETMPDDVLELLLKPVHAKMFVQLPERDGWVGETEYELFAAYWRFATTRSRDQRDHPSDAVALLELVATALEDSPGYPFTAGIRRRVGMDDAAVVRLEQVGLVRSTSDAGLVFSTDRMLNWAVAERLASQVVAGELDAATCEQTVEGLDEIAADGDPDLGRRLGYVLHDLLWILASEGRSVAVADILWSRLERRPHDLRENETWRRGIGSIGVGMLPALEILASRLADDEHHDVSFRMPLALVAIAEGNPDTVARSVGRLIGSPRSTRSVSTIPRYWRPASRRWTEGPGRGRSSSPPISHGTATGTRAPPCAIGWTSSTSGPGRARTTLSSNLSSATRTVGRRWSRSFGGPARPGTSSSGATGDGSSRTRATSGHRPSSCAPPTAPHASGPGRPRRASYISRSRIATRPSSRLGGSWLGTVRPRRSTSCCTSIRKRRLACWSNASAPRVPPRGRRSPGASGSALAT
ncbi:hypothetical protein [Qipengyuania flava]|uniref:hypothetical protein n=1 Tax=Qipengyuania flava TaxID=192812 RepID=UPI001C58C49E|nr:hypothetical protein [Qipengyuania flava]MBW3169412.1 hypothetical protein [Qipengyuania flava]MBY5966650.1 hypothetical protein [Qipengyuania flava]MBY6012974.1 hypothetical protein [Qipengyuania flava]MBY6027416.1 hypothetical protein [Qipengyuania flava]